MLYLKSLTVIALIISIAWVIADPGFEAALAVIVSTSALVSIFFIKKRHSRLKQNQSVSKSSIGVQAGGDVSIGGVGENHGK